MQVYFTAEVEELCRTYFKPTERQSAGDLAKIYSCLAPAVGRFKALDEEKQEEFRGLLTSFRNLYSFLSQVIPFQDTDLEKLYTYLRHLAKELPRRRSAVYDFDGDVQLKFYRLQKISEGTIALNAGEGGVLKGPTEVGTGKSKDEEVELSRLIDVLNERFGTNFKPADELFFEQIREEAAAREDLQEAAKVNSVDDFRFVFDKALEGIFIDRMDQNDDLFGRFMEDPDFKKVVSKMLLKQVYARIRGDGPTDDPSPA